MPTELKMPALSPTMEEGTLAKWLVKVGDEVKSGDIMAEIETDKATMEFEAVDEGTIVAIEVPEGAEGVKVGTVIATLAEEGEDASAVPKAAPAAKAEPAKGTPTAAPTPARAEPVEPKASEAQPPSSSSPKAPSPQENSSPSTSSGRADEGRVIASPLAKRIA